MSAAVWPYILDIVTIACLAVTIVFAVRLSLHLKTFRESKAGFEKLIRELTMNIDRSERAIEALRAAAQESGKALQSKIDVAQRLSDELQVMCQSGDSLASRLEKTSSRPAAVPEKKAVPAAGFMIRDPEFGNEYEEDEDDVDPENFWNEPAVSEPASFNSRAEQELYEALRGQGGKKAARTRGH